MKKVSRPQFIVALGSLGAAACSGSYHTVLPPTGGTSNGLNRHAPALSFQRLNARSVRAFVDGTPGLDFVVESDGFRMVAGGKELRVPYVVQQPSIGGTGIVIPGGRKLVRTSPTDYIATNADGKQLKVHANGNETRFSFEHPMSTDIVLTKNLLLPNPKLGKVKSLSLPHGVKSDRAGVGTVKTQSIACGSTWYFSTQYDLTCSCMVGHGTLYASCWSTGNPDIVYLNTVNSQNPITYSGNGTVTGLSACFWQVLVGAGILSATSMTESAFITAMAAAFAGVALTGIGAIALAIAILVGVLLTLGVAFTDDQVFKNLVEPCAEQYG